MAWDEASEDVQLCHFVYMVQNAQVVHGCIVGGGVVYLLVGANSMYSACTLIDAIHGNSWQYIKLSFSIFGSYI